MALSDKFYQTVCAGAIVVGAAMFGGAKYAEISEDARIAGMSHSQRAAENAQCAHDPDCTRKDIRAYQQTVLTQGVGASLSFLSLAMLSACVGNGRTRRRGQGGVDAMNDDRILVEVTPRQNVVISPQAPCSATDARSSSGQRHLARG